MAQWMYEQQHCSQQFCWRTYNEFKFLGFITVQRGVFSEVIVYILHQQCSTLLITNWPQKWRETFKHNNWKISTKKIISLLLVIAREIFLHINYLIESWQVLPNELIIEARCHMTSITCWVWPLSDTWFRTPTVHRCLWGINLPSFHWLKEEKNTFDKEWAAKLGEGTRVFLQPRKIAGWTQSWSQS